MSRQKHLNRETQQFLSGISEQYLRLRVDEDNLASFIDDHHCIWGRLEEILKRL
jgi:hypothetical protein